VIATYFFISIALIFFNKLIMTPQTFPFPLTVSWVQFAVALVCIIFFRKIGEEYVALPRLTHSRAPANCARVLTSSLTGSRHRSRSSRHSPST